MNGEVARARRFTVAALVLLGAGVLGRRAYNAWQRRPIPPREIPAAFAAALRSGDLILRRGASMESRAVRALGRDRASYSHVGLVVRDASGIFVVHALPEERARGAPGGVRREPLATFLNQRDAERAGAYRVVHASAQATAQALAWAERAALMQLPFDDEFDGRSPDKVYCTEFVLRAYASAKLELPARTRHVVLLGRAYDVVFPASLLADDAMVRVAELESSHEP